MEIQELKDTLELVKSGKIDIAELNLSALFQQFIRENLPIKDEVNVFSALVDILESKADYLFDIVKFAITGEMYLKIIDSMRMKELRTFIPRNLLFQVPTLSPEDIFASYEYITRLRDSSKIEFLDMIPDLSKVSKELFIPNTDQSFIKEAENLYNLWKGQKEVPFIDVLSKRNKYEFYTTFLYVLYLIFQGKARYDPKTRRLDFQ